MQKKKVAVAKLSKKKKNRATEMEIATRVEGLLT